MSAWLPSSRPKSEAGSEAGWSSLIELERIKDEFLLLAGLHNDLIDLIRHRKVNEVREVGFGAFTKFTYYNTDYRILDGGYWLIERGVLSVVS